MTESRELKLQQDSIVRANKRVVHKWALLLVFIAGPEVGLAKGLVGKLPGNPASCFEEPCSSDPQHVLRALKLTSYFVGVIFLMPILLYYASKLFSKLRDCIRGSGAGGDNEKKQVDKELTKEAQGGAKKGKKSKKSTEEDGESEFGEQKSGVKQEQEQQQVFATRNSAQSERHKSAASLVTSGSSHSSGGQVRPSLQLSTGKQQQEQQFEEFVRESQLVSTPTRSSSTSQPKRQRYSIMGTPNSAAAGQMELAKSAGSKSSSGHLADAGGRYNLAQHRYSMFIGAAPPNSSERGPAFGPSSPQQELWRHHQHQQQQQQRQQNNYNDERADLEAASLLRRASLRRSRHVNSPLGSMSPDLNNGSTPHSGSHASSKRGHKVFPVDGIVADEPNGGRPDSSISGGSRKQRQEASDGHVNKAGLTEQNVNGAKGAGGGQHPDWFNNKTEAEFAHRLEVPLELGPQHRHSIDRSILNNMLLLAASSEPLDYDARRESGGQFVGENNKLVAARQPAKRRADGDEGAAKRPEQLDLFQAHQRRLTQLHQLQVSSFLDDAPPLGREPGRQRQQQQQQQLHNSSSRQKERNRNGTARRQLLGGGSPTAPGAIANSGQKQQPQLFLMPHPLARERRPSLNAAALRPGAGQRQDFA